MEEKHNLQLEKTYTLWGFVLLIWALYRVYAHMPEWFDELVAKPAVFLGPVFYYVLNKEKKPLSSVGLSGGKFIRDIYIGLGFGMLFAFEGIVANAVKFGKISFTPTIPISGLILLGYVILSLATGFSEEVLVRGFLYTRLKEGLKNEFKALVYSTGMYLLLLVPFIFTVAKITGMSLVIFIMTNIIISLANTMIFSETKTITVPVLIHAFWNMAVILYL